MATAEYQVTPHPSFDDLYEVGGWSFSIDPEEDGDLAYVDNAIAAWQAWREFVVHREEEKTQEPLF